MPLPNVALEQIRYDLQRHLGERIRLRANRGRKKVLEAEGILEQIYPKLFVVRLDRNSAVKRISYTYVDVLTAAVEVTIGDNRIGDGRAGNSDESMAE
ncbi:MAG: Veg family protein [Bacteroidota bacterium]